MWIELQHIRFYFTVFNDWSGWDNYAIMPQNVFTYRKQHVLLQEQKLKQRWIARLEHRTPSLTKVHNTNPKKKNLHFKKKNN